MIVTQHNFYPFNNALAVLIDGDLCVLRHSKHGHFCGYVAFPAAETPADWAGNYDADALQYLAIHGGLTYASHESGWCVFGFDCAHAGDDENALLQNPEHIMALTKQMRDQMIAFRARLDEWRAAGREGRAKIIDEIRTAAINKTEFGFGAMIRILGGSPELGPQKGNAE